MNGMRVVCDSEGLINSIHCIIASAWCWQSCEPKIVITIKRLLITFATLHEYSTPRLFVWIVSQRPSVAPNAYSKRNDFSKIFPQIPKTDTKNLFPLIQFRFPFTIYTHLAAAWMNECMKEGSKNVGPCHAGEFTSHSATSIVNQRPIAH